MHVLVHCTITLKDVFATLLTKLEKSTVIVKNRLFKFLSDYLDNGNNKRALQEAEKVLKKQPDFPCCKVLKALALMRMGREDEAQPLIDSVLEESPTDESTLQAMNIAYKELQQRKL